MALERYRQKRDATRSPEPAGEPAATTSGPLRFVVQKHAARRLHYDLRLELGGVLKSWAVPKGPCLDPTQKRLAVHVEDHPLEYAGFEGVIPEGQYGAGTMLVWDRGTWSADAEAGEGDADGQYRAGMIKFHLDGEKLRGRWMLVRMKPKPGETADNWLLVKERDEEARPLAEYDVLEALPDSVQSGGSILDVEAGRDLRRGGCRVPDLEGVAGAVRGALPSTIRVQLAEPADKPPSGERWLHEIKFDGYRLLAWQEAGRVRLMTRRGQDWTERFPHVAAGVRALGCESVILDGELVGLLPDGSSSFQALLAALREGRVHTLVYFVFDVLYLEGYDLRKVALERRKEVLCELLCEPEDSAGAKDMTGRTGRETRATRVEVVQYADHLIGDGQAFFDVCRQRGLEGIVSKRRDRPHRSGRTADWLKIKSLLREEFVIGGFTEPEGSREGLGAILVGYFDAAGRLVYAGKVGTGFDRRTLTDLRDRLEAIELRKKPFVELPRERIDRGTRWVEPCLVAQVEYANWTSDGLLWHPSFQGLREDIPARAVVRGAAGDEAEIEVAGGVGRPAPNQGRPAPNQGRPAPNGEPDAEAGGTAGSRRASASRREPIPDDHLAALASIRVTSPERVLYPRPGITKLDLMKFYVEIADWILPHVTGRPLSLVRCPEGVGGGQRFFQKHATPGTPEAIRRVRVREDKTEYLAIDDLAGLISLVQMGVLEIHPWGARVDRPDRPDRMFFDLDPGEGVDWSTVIVAARRIRDVLGDLGLTSFVKTTGGKGLHVVVPLDRRQTWEAMQEFSTAVAKRVSADSPGRFTLSFAKKARTGRIYIDCLRNARGATAVGAYSTRANDEATVSVPLGWDELSPQIGPDYFTVRNLASRLASLGHDPWSEIGNVRQSLTGAMRKKLGL